MVYPAGTPSPPCASPCSRSVSGWSGRPSHAGDGLGRQTSGRNPNTPVARISRRRALHVLLASSSLGAFSWRAAHAQSFYDGPLVDAHAHLRSSAGVSIDDLIELYDAAGVQGAHLFGEPWPLATDACDRYPARVVPILAEGYANALHPDSSYLHPEGLEQLLSSGVVRGLGEVICRHSAYRLGAAGGFYAAPANHVPADHPALLEAYRTAGRFGGHVNIHQEWFFADELERAFRAAPGTTFVWAHAGHGSAEVTRGVLRRNPNVTADLSARTPWIARYRPVAPQRQHGLGLGKGARGVRRPLRDRAGPVRGCPLPAGVRRADRRVLPETVGTAGSRRGAPGWARECRAHRPVPRSLALTQAQSLLAGRSARGSRRARAASSHAWRDASALPSHDDQYARIVSVTNSSGMLAAGSRGQ